MSLCTIATRTRFVLSIIVINFFDPLLASIPTRMFIPAFPARVPHPLALLALSLEGS